MNKRDALKLRPGARIVFGDSQFTAKCTGFAEGTVQRVTPRGGIRVRVGKSASWIPYNHVVRVIDRGPGQGAVTIEETEWQ